MECGSQGPYTTSILANNKPAGRVSEVVVSEGDFACAILENRAVSCWGKNSAVGETLPANLKAKQITVGEDFVCAINLADKVQCFGKNNFGQLNAPSDLAREIDAEGHHICIIKKTDNRPLCWGQIPNGVHAVPMPDIEIK